ncbi:hypothetical protein [Lysobacter gummosus]
MLPSQRCFLASSISRRNRSSRTRTVRRARPARGEYVGGWR